MKNRKFELKTKKHQTVYEISINIRSEESKLNTTSFHKDGVFVEEHKIVFQTSLKTALNDKYITLFYRQIKDEKKSSYSDYIENINVSVVLKEDYFPNGIFCKCYTLENPEKIIKKMKRKIITEVNKNYGFLLNIDLEKTLNNMKINQ